MGERQAAEEPGKWRRPWLARAGFFAAAALVAGLPVVPASADPARGADLACPNPVADAFTDDDASVHEPAINCMARWEVARGTSEGSYGPEVNVRRDQTASFVVRLMRTAGFAFDGDPEDQFDDDDGSVHETSINQLAAAGVVRGSGPGAFGPSRDVTRGQMAALLNRALEALGHAEPEPHEHFDDDDGSVFETDIDALASLGIVEGTGQALYRPDLTVRRAPMAAFLARTADRFAEQGSWPTSTGPIAAPMEFAATQGEGSQVLLSWIPAEDIRVDFYFLQIAVSPPDTRCDTPRVYGFAETLRGRSTHRYTHDAEPGMTYCYRLRAVDNREDNTQTDAPPVFAGPITVE